MLFVKSSIFLISILQHLYNNETGHSNNAAEEKKIIIIKQMSYGYTQKKAAAWLTCSTFEI